MKFPDGTLDSSKSAAVVGTFIAADAPPGSAEKAQRHHDVMKQLIAEKKYKFVTTMENPSSSQTEYVYRFTLPDGENLNMNFSKLSFYFVFS